MSATPELDLRSPRGARALLRDAVRLFAGHSGLFLSLTLLCVAPVVILVDGVWRGELYDGNAVTDSGSLAVGTILELLMPVLVTALHVAVVRALGEGRLLDVGEALNAAAPRFPAALGASIVYAVLAFAGFLALIVPGVWLLVGGYFGAQIAVIERAGPIEAVKRSIQLVAGHWWRTAGLLLAGWICFFAVFFPANLVIAGMRPGVLHIVLLTLVRALDLSLTALYGTLAYFSVKATASRPLAAA